LEPIDLFGYQQTASSDRNKLDDRERVLHPCRCGEGTFIENPRYCGVIEGSQVAYLSKECFPSGALILWKTLSTNRIPMFGPEEQVTKKAVPLPPRHKKR
jgi:hypothetical protein